MALTGRTRVAAVVGSPVRHSLSPAIFNAAFEAAGLDWAYAAFEVPEGAGADAVRAARVLGLAGLSVTMPLKAEVAAAVDECSPDAAALGAVNCVVPVDGRLRGENTDGEGFVRSLLDAGVDPGGARCLLVGAGGAARAVALALARHGAAEVVVANRTAARAEQAAALAGRVGSATSLDDLRAHVGAADLIVNATSVGMGGHGSPLAGVQLEGGTSGPVVADLVYQPVTTPLLAAAAAAGCRTVDGVGMLVHQAALAFEHWAGRDAPLSVMRDAAARQLRGQNIAPTS